MRIRARDSKRKGLYSLSLIVSKRLSQEVQYVFVYLLATTYYFLKLYAYLL